MLDTVHLQYMHKPYLPMLQLMVRVVLLSEDSVRVDTDQNWGVQTNSPM